MSMSTKVCSSHFAAGYCSDVCPIPTLFLKGYKDEPTMKWKVPIGQSDRQPASQSVSQLSFWQKNLQY